MIEKNKPAGLEREQVVTKLILGLEDIRLQATHSKSKP
jgi:hypothetical protein